MTTERQSLAIPANAPVVVPLDVLIAIKEAVARVEVKLDGVSTLAVEVQSLRDRVLKLEGWQKFVMLVAGGIWTLTVVGFGALLAWYH